MSLIAIGNPVHNWSDLRFVPVGACDILMGTLPESVLDSTDFDSLWNLHPVEQPTITMYSKPVQLPRWQKSYNRDYFFSGQMSVSDPIPELLMPLYNWARELYPQINGLLLNWYDAASKHYIGAHTDSISQLQHNSHIITVSFGASRTFRMRDIAKRHLPVDIQVENGDVLVIPWETNQQMTHEVLHRARDTGRRVSVTFRVFA